MGGSFVAFYQQPTARTDAVEDGSALSNKLTGTSDYKVGGVAAGL